MVFGGRLKGVDYSGTGKGRLKWFSTLLSDGLDIGRDKLIRLVCSNVR